MWIHDANDIEFASLMIANDIIVTALGDITDTSDSNIRVANWGSFSGANIAFGNNDSDIGTTEFFQVTLSSPGHVELYLDSSVVFTGINNMALWTSTRTTVFRMGAKPPSMSPV